MTGKLRREERTHVARRRLWERGLTSMGDDRDETKRSVARKNCSLADTIYNNVDKSVSDREGERRRNFFLSPAVVRIIRSLIRSYRMLTRFFFSFFFARESIRDNVLLVSLRFKPDTQDITIINYKL